MRKTFGSPAAASASRNFAGRLVRPLASIAAQARRDGRMAVIDLKRVTHLHYAGAALLKAIPGLRAAGASRYVRDLVHAGGAAGYVELYDDVEEAVRAA